MTHKEVVKWLESLKKEIGKAENRTLWHYAESIDMAIEALKAPTGLISKKDVKWQIQEWINELNEAIDMLDSIPSAEPQWIPVSERFPGKDGRYLVTYPLLGDDLWVSTAWYGTPPMPNRPVKGKCFFVSDDEWGDVPYDDVVAWMPLPGPYKGGDSDG